MAQPFISLLAHKLLSESVLFFVGAGLSMNWGLPNGSALARWLFRKYRVLGVHLDELTEELLGDSKLQQNLPQFTELLARNKGWFLRKVLYHPGDPPLGSNFFKETPELIEDDPVDAGRIGVPHIVFGRLAKEGLIQEIMTTNYDCLLEAGCAAVGMIDHDTLDDDSAILYPWPETYRVIANRRHILHSAPQRHVFHIHKIHGCVADLAKTISATTACDEPGRCQPSSVCSDCPLDQRRFNFVITYRELADWRHDAWARDLFYDRVRSDHIVFVGSDGADTVLHAALRSVYDEVWSVSDDPPYTGNAVPVGSTPSGGPLDDDLPGQSPRDQVASAVMGNSYVPTHAMLPRAQATEFSRSFFMRQLLRTAANGQPDAEAQIWRLDQSAPRRSLEAMFSSAYTTTIKELLLRRLAWYWNGWAEEVLLRELGHKSSGDEESDVTPNLLQMANDAGQRLRRLVKGLDVERFWYDSLPTATRLSWLLNQMRLSEPGLMHRLGRPHYYVPLGANDGLVFPLLAFYAFLRDLHPTLRWASGGWVVLCSPARPSGEQTATVLIPVVVTGIRNLIRRLHVPLKEINPPAMLARSPKARPVLVLVGDQSRGKTWGWLPAIAGAVSALARVDVSVVSLCYNQLLDEEAFSVWLNSLLLGGQDPEAGERGA